MSKITEINEKIADTENEIRQLKNREKTLVQKKTVEERKARTRRLIERGAILESVLPSIIHLSNDEVMTLLSDISHLPEVRKLTSKTPEALATE